MCKKREGKQPEVPFAHKDLSHARVFLLRFRYAIHRAVCVSVGAILPRRTAIEPISFILPSSLR